MSQQQVQAEGDTAWYDQCPTDRELEILQLFANGYRRTAAAAELGISEETVKTHVKHAKDKLAAKNITQAVAISIRNELID